MSEKYIFYYDESEHSRSITKETINASNFASNFVACIIGFESKRLDEINFKFNSLEEHYKSYYSVSELKSSILSKSKYKYGLKSLKSKDLELVNDVFNFVLKENLEVYSSLQNKIEYVVSQLLNDYDNDIFFDADAFRYSISKIVNQYRPQKVIDSIFLNDGSFVFELKDFFKTLLTINKDNPIKASENAAIEENLLILDSYNKLFIIKWDYRISFDGFNLFLNERMIGDYSLAIDKEGYGNTLNAALSCCINDPFEVDSREGPGIRIADMVAGVVSRFVVSLDSCLSYKNIYDGQHLKYLEKEWFNIDKNTFDSYKIIKKVIVDLNKSWYKTYCTHYSDTFLYFIALIDYFASYESYEKYIDVSIDEHQQKLNSLAVGMLQERFQLLRNKLKIEPVNASPIKSEFYLNQKGAKCYFDYSKHEELEIDGKTKKYNVLSVGFFGKMEKACITIEEEGKPVCYLLPDGLFEWAFNCVAISNCGVNMFPSNVAFTKINSRYFADIE